MDVEPLTEAPPRPAGHPALHQRWRDLTMLHWPLPPEEVAPLLPAGTRPDVLDGVTWVGLVPFVMTGVRAVGTPALPWLSSFAETNVRLYAVDNQGRRGVVFRSLESSRLLPVLAARASYRLAYMWARMSVRHDGDTVTYASSRRWPGPRGAGARIRVRIGQPYEADELSLFLTARWRLFGTWYGGLSTYTPVEHEPWPLHRAEVLDLSEDLVAQAGFPQVAGTPHVLWSPGVSVRAGLPRRL
jgi:hypothetical protein